MLKPFPGLLILIPAYNEARSIGGVVAELVDGGHDVLVIDDGSSDETAKIVEKAGAHALVNDRNRGKGASLRRGFLYAVEQGFGAVITMDGDGQHDPGSIPDFCAAWRGGSDLVLGRRKFDYDNMPFMRAVTNKCTSHVITWFCQQRFGDTQCGYRLVSTRILKKLFVDRHIVTSQRYDMESEVIIEASAHGFPISEVFVPTIYNNSASNIRPFVDTMRFFKLVFKCLLRR